MYSELKPKTVIKNGECYKLNSPFYLQQPKINSDFKPCLISGDSKLIYNIFILQSVYSHSLIVKDVEIFDDINNSIATNKNILKNQIQNYHNAINWLNNNSLQDKDALIKILNLIAPELKINGYRTNNIQVKTFYKSSQKYWYFADPEKITALVENYIETIKMFDDKNVLPYVYPQLILIHPFKNGNGRLSRFLQIYYSYKLYKKTEQFFPAAFFYRNVPENREFEHKKIKNYCLTNNAQDIQLWFDDYLEYGKNQLQYIETEVLKHHKDIENEFGENVFPKDMLFQININSKNMSSKQLKITEQLVKKQYFVKIDGQYLNLLLCTMISLLKKNRKEFNSLKTVKNNI